MSRGTTALSRHARKDVIREMLRRSRARLKQLSDSELADALEDALYEERKRVESAHEQDEGYTRLLEDLARALVRGSRASRVDAGLELVAAWADEVHGRFSPRVYRFVTSALPSAIARLLVPKRGRLREWRPSLDSGLQVQGDLPFLRELADEATLILAPTHLSNLDSPLIGLSLYMAGLPPFRYGAGLNLFTNPIMGFFMARLGAYTVDRTKRSGLYKALLKDYSVWCLTTRQHSLFFPGGTRNRSGAIEKQVKKGLLGTGLEAWQEMLESGRSDSEIYVVPHTLSYSLVLEANTLIEDHLAEQGRQRFIIDDDESAQPRRVVAFGRRVLELDGAVVSRFGEPMDLLGHPVPRDKAQRREVARRRRDYVCDRDGRVQRDAQRDRVYTDRLASALVESYPRAASIMPTHLAAWVGWRCLQDSAGTRDTFRLIRAPSQVRRIHREVYLERLRRALELTEEGARQGRWHNPLPSSAEEVLAQALDRFGRYHRSRALVARGDDLMVEDPRLCLYYANRLDHTGWEL